MEKEYKYMSKEYDINDIFGSKTLEETIEVLSKIKKELKGLGYKKITCSIRITDHDDYWESVYIDFNYQRLETDEEARKRISKSKKISESLKKFHAKKKANKQNKKYQDRRALWLELEKEFGGKK